MVIEAFSRFRANGSWFWMLLGWLQSRCMCCISPILCIGRGSFTPFGLVKLEKLMFPNS